MRRLGFDISGVIIDIDEDKISPERYHELFCTEEKKYRFIPAVKEAFLCLSELNKFFRGEIYLISHAYPKHIEEVTRDWLTFNNFFGITRISQNNVYFCDTIREISGLCDQLAITDMVDDRLEILSALPNVERKYLFNGRRHEIEKTGLAYLSQVKRVSSFKDLIMNLGRK